VLHVQRRVESRERDITRNGSCDVSGQTIRSCWQNLCRFGPIATRSRAPTSATVKEIFRARCRCRNAAIHCFISGAIVSGPVVSNSPRTSVVAE